MSFFDIEFHTADANSKCALTKAGYNIMNNLILKNLKAFLILPSALFAVDTSAST